MNAKNKADTRNKVKADDNTGKAGLHPKISTRRLWLFRISAAIIMPVILFVLLEISLRVIGYGYPTSAFVKCHIKNRVAYCSNLKFAWQFFPPKISRQFDPPFVVPEEKEHNSYRIFILGESAAMGQPEQAFCFGRQLRVMLRQQYPSVNFEIFTVAMPAINSHAVALIAKDCARLKPDLFVVYMGNNEVIGPYGAGTVFAPLSKSLLLIRLGIAIKGTRTGELMTSIVGGMKKTPEEWGGLSMFLAKQIRHDDEQMQYVYSHFRSNLEDIIKSAQKAGAKTIVSNIAVNLRDCPPFSSLHRPNLGDGLKQFDAFFKHGVELEKAGDFNGAVDSYLSAAGIDETYAELQFRMGRCLWSLEQFDKAREYYIRAMDYDTLRFRADSIINRIIREVSADKTAQGVYFVDSVDAFAKNSPENSPGYELFWEHVHFTFHGNYLLAKTIFRSVDQILPDAIKKQKSADALVSEAGCAKLMAYTDFDDFSLTKFNFHMISKQPIFINQVYHDETADFWMRKTEKLKVVGGDSEAFNKAMKQYEEAIKLDSNDIFMRRRYAIFLWQRGKNPLIAVVTLYRQIVEQLPHDVKMLTQLAEMEYRLGDIDSGLKHAVKAVELNSMNDMAYYSEGMLYERKGQYEKAKKDITRAIKLSTPPVALYYDSLASILNREGKYDQVEQVYRKGIKAIPTDPSLHFNLALLLQKKGQLQEAEKERQKAKLLAQNQLNQISQENSAAEPMK
jgi:tetratricopeptide (TPR) repeat protein